MLHYLQFSGEDDRDSYQLLIYHLWQTYLLITCRDTPKKEMVSRSSSDFTKGQLKMNRKFHGRQKLLQRGTASSGALVAFSMDW